MLRKIKRGGRNNRYRHTSDATRNRRYAKRADKTYILVPYNGYNSSYKHFVHHRISILLRGFYERYSLGKNAAGNDFPNDNSGADSHYGGRSIWGQIDNLINRYHWTLEYILWGISWANVQLMISDALKTDCKSKSTTNIPNNEQSKVPDIIVLPFLQALGYDIFNPEEVTPECICDYGTKKGEKIDYTVCMDGEPIMLIECKHWSADLSKYKAQLFRYYHVSQAKFGVLTNGINYQFYTDLDTPNKMDDKPFFEIDMLNLKDSHIEKLKQFRHDQYNTYMILNSATEMKYINALRSLIVKESSNPSDLFVKFMTKQVYDGVVTKNIIDEFRPMIQRAFQQYTNDYINERLKSAITPDVPSVEVSSNVSTEKSVANEEDMQDGNKIVTTDEELMGFYIVRAILCNTVDLDRVVDRDAQSYFAILFDDNNRKPICRLHFNGGKKYVETFDEEKKGTKHLITALTDIYKLSDQLISTVKFYLK